MNETESPLEGKVAIVTGGARNIGRSIAKRLASYGVSVVVNAVQDREAADAVAHEIFEAGGRALAHICDITDEDAVNEMAETAVKAFGSVDILVSNASIRAQKPFLEIDTEEWHRTLAVPLDGAFFCARACAPHMIKNKWGRIITIGGISAYIGTANRVGLLAAKSGLVGLTRGLAVELADHGITCNVVSPGHINTVRPGTAGARPPMKVEPPIKRFGHVEEIAGMVHYLCLPEAAYITGQTMHINGGLYYGV
ncbi:MAG: SDR family oxidoreductase [Rhodospirillaceae bacterium]|jgi:3-oxoacyl-[acyl-carrier protein] reductase|nr:SDR family oxidoreductase [Rhodospirillaceae bacterium]MBT3909267.1 SDR family oxidoreductase [Rhodospirillaceae bacterium]MBT5298266.1 SDR family oxidoreductase [Rhodospirillaceae bacterium]MBT5516064.1 SDR family oxidoreductase [Rhodospirillaceae bacterium]MBT6087284.1 SDR family oxidoreductase [Rhodospirillaceae bacterium]